MGLDITAYSKLKKLDVVFDASGEPIDPVTREVLPWQGYTQACVNSDFPGRAGSLEHGACYSYESSIGFRAGSYSGYNAWREALATLAGYPEEPYVDYAGATKMRRDAAAWAGKADGLPFVELVNFSDCEGDIGPDACAKLAKDFADWDERAKAFSASLEWFYALYTEWRKAFELAADGGCVSFH